MIIKRKRNFFKKLTVFAFSIICIVGCVFIAQFFASALTTGALYVSSSNSNALSDFKVYAVSLGSYSTKSLAESSATSYRKKNAAGYVYKIDERYYVLASAYEKENDARLVKENLQKEGEQCDIVIISFKEVKLNNVSSTSQEKDFLETLNVFKSTFVGLYDISISLDTAVIDETKAKIEIIALKAKVEERLQKINKGTTSIDGIYYQIIKSKYNELIAELDALKNYEQVGGIFLSGQIKFIYLKILDIAEDLIDTLNNEI